MGEYVEIWRGGEKYAIMENGEFKKIKEDVKDSPDKKDTTVIKETNGADKNVS
jgi:hypothetical protein